jgi:hypothetical protein
MIERKLEGLDDSERQLLRVAAVQGFEFDSAIVADALGRDPADVEDGLQSHDRVHGLVQLLREQVFPNRLFLITLLFCGSLSSPQSALRASRLFPHGLRLARSSIDLLELLLKPSFAFGALRLTEPPSHSGRQRA